MNLDKLGRTLGVIAAVAILAMVLQGCGGDSGSGISQDMYDTLMMERDEAQGRVTELEAQIGAEVDPALGSLRNMLAAANADVMRLTGELTDADADVMRLTGELTDADADVVRLTGELTDADADVVRLTGELTDADADVVRLTGELTGADADVVRLTGELTDADADVVRLTGELKTANDELIKIRQDAADALAAAALADRIAREAAISTAVGLNRVGTAAKALPDAISGATAVAATRDAAGAVGIDVNGAAIDDVYAGGEVTADASGWTSATLTKTDAVTEATDTLMIYTDIEAPTDKLFTDQYDRATRDDILNDADRATKAASGEFPSGSSQQLTYGGNSGNPVSFDGTFDGISGTYECTSGGGTCTLGTDADGDLAVATDWRFTPNSNLATVKDPDTAYAYFGWWLNMPKDNTVAHDVEVFAGGTTGNAANVTDEIVGNATYSGPAAGQYITKTYTAGAQTEAGVGQFTATANLTAKFGADNAAGTIAGAVSSFVLDGNTSAPSWRVVLEEATLTNGSEVFNGTSEVNFGGGLTDGATAAGTWQGSFYADADAADLTNAPGAVAGTFDAVTDNAAVIGGFGATK